MTPTLTLILLAAILVLAAPPAILAMDTIRKRHREAQLEPEELPINTGQRELDEALSALLGKFTAEVNEAVDEIYTSLAHAYPGMYADPDAPTQSVVEWRVTETTGHVRWLQPAAAVHAHRLGLKVERRVVTVTEWEEEPNPNTRKPKPIAAHPKMSPTADLVAEVAAGGADAGEVLAMTPAEAIAEADEVTEAADVVLSLEPTDEPEVAAK